MTGEAAESPGNGTRRWVPALLGLLALGLGAVGEYVIRSRITWGLGLGLYLAAIAVFSWKAWPLPSPDTAGEAAPGRSRFRLVVLSSAVLAAVVLTAVEFRSLSGQTQEPAVRLWLAAALALAAGSIAAGPITAFAPRWPLPPRLGWRRAALFACAVVAVLGLACATRFPDLELIPYGINADEGDQAMVGIQLLRHTRSDELFGVGWYHIGMMYFRALAFAMSIFGVSVGGARVLGAVCGVATVALVLGIGVRNFGRRAGLLAGTLAAGMGAAIQFSRETTVAGPTMLLWTASGAFFFEAARTGRAWAWVFAGLSGGASIYFYPTGRLWGVVAAIFTIGLIIRGPKGTRGRVVAGTALAAAAALAIMTPFFRLILEHPDIFYIRARETTIFIKENPLRLSYYDPAWSTAKLVMVQLEHAIGIFNRFPDGNYFWPIPKPILPPAFAMLALLGLGSCVVKIRDERFLLLSSWFCLGFVGVVVTVETPNLHRMATAIPVVPLCAALVLDDVARRFEGAGPDLSPRRRAWSRSGAGLAAAVVALALSASEVDYYFRDYAKQDRWPWPRTEGEGIAALGPGCWAFGLGRIAHVVSSGWVYLYAPWVPRGSIFSPGSSLPVALIPNRDLAFIVPPRQAAYLPLLRELHPGGTVTRATHQPDVVVFDVYRVPGALWAGQLGALAERPGSAAVHVTTLGAVPPGWSAGAATWHAALRVPRYWNYGFRIGPGPARLVVDGRTILEVPPGSPVRDALLCLAQGDHQIRFEGLIGPHGEPATFRWAMANESATLPETPRWEDVLPSQVFATASEPGGLFARLVHEGRPEIHRRDRTIASGGLADEMRSSVPDLAIWTGTLLAPKSGRYAFAFRAQGEVEMDLDGRQILKGRVVEAEPATASVELLEGPHPVEIRYRAETGPGFIEWQWKTPSGPESIVPPSALALPPGAGVGPPEPLSAIGPAGLQPPNRPIELRW